MKSNKPFNFGKYLIEYRTERDGNLHFLKKKIDDLDEALKETQKLRDMGYHDIFLRKNG